MILLLDSTGESDPAYQENREGGIRHAKQR